MKTETLRKVKPAGLVTTIETAMNLDAKIVEDKVCSNIHMGTHKVLSYTRS